MRIHIIGGSGSGKSFIATKIADKYNLKIINLDNIEWEKSDYFSKKRDINEKLQILDEILYEDNIILEGVYYNWCDSSFKKSDYIFYINTPLYIQQSRIIKRSIKRKLNIEKSDFKETIKSIYDLLKWNKKYNTSLKKEIFKKLELYNNKVYNVSTLKDIDKVIGGNL